MVTADDNLAAGVVKFGKRMSIPIPEKLRVIGFNNSYITEYCEPELSSIDNRFLATGICKARPLTAETICGKVVFITGRFDSVQPGRSVSIYGELFKHWQCRI